MPNEPEHPVEKLLQEAARKRREAAGAPFELHPATRRLFQGEVGRRFPTRHGAARASFFKVFWPRFALTALGLFAVLVGVFSLLPHKTAEKPQLLAKTEETRPEPALEPSAQLAPQKNKQLAETAPRPDAGTEAPARAERPASPAVMPPFTPFSKDADKETITLYADGSRQPNVKSDGPDQKLAIAPRSSAPAAAPAPGGLASAEARQGANLPTPQGSVSGGPFPPPATPTQIPQERLMRAADEVGSATASGSAARVAQKADFVSVATADALAAQQSVRSRLDDSAKAQYGAEMIATGPVMVSFTLEQVGQELRVVDQDGSIYAGPIQSLERQEVYSRKLNLRNAAPTDSAPRAQATQTATTPVSTYPFKTYFFELTGTNRSLNKRVVFTGTLLPTNTIDSVSKTQATAFGGLGATPPSGTVPLLNSRISGKLMVGESPSIELNAVPVRR